MLRLLMCLDVKNHQIVRDLYYLQSTIYNPQDKFESQKMFSIVIKILRNLTNLPLLDNKGPKISALHAKYFPFLIFGQYRVGKNRESTNISKKVDPWREKRRCGLSCEHFCYLSHLS